MIDCHNAVHLDMKTLTFKQISNHKKPSIWQAEITELSASLGRLTNADDTYSSTLYRTASSDKNIGIQPLGQKSFFYEFVQLKPGQNSSNMVLTGIEIEPIDSVLLILKTFNS